MSTGVGCCRQQLGGAARLARPGGRAGGRLQAAGSKTAAPGGGRRRSHTFCSACSFSFCTSFWRRLNSLRTAAGAGRGRESSASRSSTITPLPRPCGPACGLANPFLTSCLRARPSHPPGPPQTFLAGPTCCVSCCLPLLAAPPIREGVTECRSGVSWGDGPLPGHPRTPGVPRLSRPPTGGGGRILVAALLFKPMCFVIYSDCT